MMEKAESGINILALWLKSFKHRSKGLLALRPTDGLPRKLKTEFGRLVHGHLAESWMPSTFHKLLKGGNGGVLALTELAGSLPPL